MSEATQTITRVCTPLDQTTTSNPGGFEQPRPILAAVESAQFPKPNSSFQSGVANDRNCTNHTNPQRD